MSSVLRQPVNYPVSVVFVDDSLTYLSALRRFFPDTQLVKFFNNPWAALNLLTSTQQMSALNGQSVPLEAGMEQKGCQVDDIAYVDQRFSEICAVVVDYKMPELDGISFLSSIKDIPCSKILLTGIADEKVAVDAFNLGILDFYLHKSDSEFVDKLIDVLSGAQRRHCLSRAVPNTRGVGLQYCDLRALGVMYSIIERENIVEYYWRPEQNVVLMFDVSATPSIFIVWNESDWIVHCDAMDHSANDRLKVGMKARSAMPVFWPFMTYQHEMSEIGSVSPEPVPGWDGTFYGWSKIDATKVDERIMTFCQWRKR